MNQRQTRRYEQLLGVVSFLTQHRSTLGPECRASRDRLRGFAAEIGAIELREANGSALHAMRVAAAARRALRIKHLIPLSRQARRAFRDDPLVLDHLRVPHKNAGGDEIAAAGARMLDALDPYRAHLDALHVDASRLDRLRGALDHFDALRVHTLGVAPARRANGRALQEILAMARADILAVDATIRADHLTLLKQWLSVMRMPKRRGRPPRPASSARKTLDRSGVRRTGTR